MRWLTFCFARNLTAMDQRRIELGEKLSHHLGSLHSMVRFSRVPCRETVRLLQLCGSAQRGRFKADEDEHPLHAPQVRLTPHFTFLPDPLGPLWRTAAPSDCNLDWLCDLD